MSNSNNGSSKGLGLSILIGIAAGGIVVIVLAVILFSTLLKNTEENTADEPASASVADDTVTDEKKEESAPEPEPAKPTAPPVTQAEVNALYKNYLENLDIEKDEYDEYLYQAAYYLFDVNRDGIDELILTRGASVADTLLTVIEYDNGELLFSEEISGNCGIFGSKEGGLNLHYGGAAAGFEEVIHLDIEKGKLTQTTIVERHAFESATELAYDIPLEHHWWHELEPLS